MARSHEDDDASNGHAPGARLKEFLETLSDELQDFTRRKPLEGLIVSFLAGLVIGELIRRNR